MYLSNAKTKLDQLCAVRDRLAEAIDESDRPTVLPSLVNQYRQTLHDITVETEKQVEAANPAEDALARARAARAARSA